jgi:GrpB-like predicted nucleotidyltransferase (UPF0157 family)
VPDAIIRGMDLRVVEPDPGWPAAAAELIAEVRAAVPGAYPEIEHISSAAVPDLVAKPVVDLMAATDDLVAAAECGPYATAPALGVHLHVVELGGWATRNQRILRAHSRDADRYAALKRELATRVADRDAYTRGKTALVQEIVDRARAERGLPSVDGIAARNAPSTLPIGLVKASVAAKATSTVPAPRSTSTISRPSVAAARGRGARPSTPSQNGPVRSMRPRYGRRRGPVLNGIDLVGVRRPWPGK